MKPRQPAIFFAPISNNNVGGYEKILSGANSDRTILEDERGRFVRRIHELKPRPCGEVFYSRIRPT